MAGDLHKPLIEIMQDERNAGYEAGIKWGRFQERERIMKIFASFGKIQLKKPLSGAEFEALFDFDEEKSL